MEPSALIGQLHRALDYAIDIIESYEIDVRNSEPIVGIDLAKRGFCQGSIYKQAVQRVKDIAAGRSYGCDFGEASHLAGD